MACALLVALLGRDAAGTARRAQPPKPDVVLITIDTLRADRLGCYGYARPTTPHLDALLNRGVRFDKARTVEPLTHPALSSMLTGLPPHRHGGSRNGLRIHAGLPSLPKALERAGYRTAAFVGNWTLRHPLSGLAEHFDDYASVLTRARWFGLIRREAEAADLNHAALDWLDQQREADPQRPRFLWVHYTEPHAPYRSHDAFRERLGLPRRGKLDGADRYDTEVAAVDAAVGALLQAIEQREPRRDRLIVFASDHGESLGEHGYWGHGRQLYEPGLRIPMGLVWPGRIRPSVEQEPALLIDVASTVAGLLELKTALGSAAAFDWSRRLRQQGPGPGDRITFHQAHKGAVIARHESALARRSGLLAVARIEGPAKESFRVRRGRLERFRLDDDPLEQRSLAGVEAEPHPQLQGWLREVYDGLERLDEVPPAPLNDEDIEALRSLGYVGGD